MDVSAPSQVHNEPSPPPASDHSPSIPNTVSSATPQRSAQIAALPTKSYTELCMSPEYLMFLEDFHAISHHDLFLVQSNLNTSSNSLTKQYDILHIFHGSVLLLVSKNLALIKN